MNQLANQVTAVVVVGAPGLHILYFPHPVEYLHKT